MKIKHILPIVLLAVASTALRADHPPEWLVAKTAPERSLAKIEVGQTKVGEVIRAYGKPTSGGPIKGFSGEAEYVWSLENSELHASTMYPPGRAREEQIIHAVEVRQKEGKTSGAATGAKVKMGAELKDLIAVYGPIYMTDWRDLSKESRSISYIFENETELTFGFSDDGHVIAILLAESME